MNLVGAKSFIKRTTIWKLYVFEYACFTIILEITKIKCVRIVLEKIFKLKIFKSETFNSANRDLLRRSSILNLALVRKV
jgi:hypothetical protein